jgi:hypothetical protein
MSGSQNTQQSVAEIDYAALATRSSRSGNRQSGPSRADRVFAALLSADPSLLGFAEAGHTHDTVSTGKDRSGPGTVGLYRSFRIYDTDRIYMETESGVRRLEFGTRPADQFGLLNLVKAEPGFANGTLYIFRLTPKGATKTIEMDPEYVRNVAAMAGKG